MKKLMVIFVIGFILCIAAGGYGEILSFSVTPDRTRLANGEQMIVTATIVSNRQLAKSAPPQLPPSEDFTVIRTTQNQSQSTSIQILNGRTEQKVEITYQYSYFIAPRHGGTFTFPALSLSADGKNLASNPFEVTVSNEQVRNADVRVMVLASDRSLVIGQQTTLTVKVAQRAQSPAQLTEQGFVALFDAVEKALGKNFSMYKLFGNSLKATTEQVGGEAHRVYTLRWALFPLVEGPISIPAIPFEYVENQRVQRQRSNDPFFDDFFFGGGVQQVPKSTASNPLSIQVAALPSPPSGFCGAVGDFSINASLSMAEVPVGEAVTLTVAIKGNTRSGNLPDPILEKLDFAETFSPEKQVIVDTLENGIVSRKVNKYMIVPREEGTHIIPAITLTYFNPATKSYVTTSTPSLSLIVTKGKGASTTSSRYLTQEDIQMVGSDIRYIKTGVALRSQSAAAHRRPLFFVLFPLPFLAMLFATLYRFQSVRRQKNAATTLRARALRKALRSLDFLSHPRSDQSAAQFIANLTEVMLEYISRRFAFSAIGKTMDELRFSLSECRVDATIAAKCCAQLERLDGYRFGGVTLDETLRSKELAEARETLVLLEKTPRIRRAAKPGFSALFLALIISGAVLHSNAANSDELLFEKANTAYETKQFDSAAVFYSRIIENGVENSSLYYNLGNSHFRLGNTGLAILYFEKAHALAPNDPDITANLRYASRLISDRTPEPQRGFLEAVMLRLHTTLSLNAQLWVLWFLLCIIAASVSISLFVSRNKRLWLIYCAILGAVMVGLVGLSAGIKMYELERVAYGIVLGKSVDAKNGPDGTKVLFTVHEGTKFRIHKMVDDWLFVSLPNGVSGWVPQGVIGKI